MGKYLHDGLDSQLKAVTSHFRKQAESLSGRVSAWWSGVGWCSVAAGGAVCGGDVYDGWRCGSVLAGTQQRADLRCATPRSQPHRALARAAPEQRAGCSATGGGGAGPAAGRSSQVSSEREVWGGAGPGHAPSPPQPSEGGQVCSAAGGGRPAVRLNCTAPAGPCGATHLTGSLQQILTVPPTNHTTNPPHAGPQLEERGCTIKLG